MTIYLQKFIPREQLIVIHAELPGVDWDQNVEHIRETIGDLEYHNVRARKTFFEMVRHRGKFPSASIRQCTSDLKRNPIQTKIRQICNERGIKIVVNCMGLRAEESPGRAKKEVFTQNKNQTNRKRVWYEYLPIHDYKLDEVWRTIEEAGQKPHYAYGLGMSRLSCRFCIMSSIHDLKVSAKHNPEILEQIDALEKELDFTFIMPTKKDGKRTLKEIVGG